MSLNDVPSPHRLFAAIVLMGTGLAAGCGGVSQGSGDGTDPEHPNVSAGGGGASAGTGSSAGADAGIGAIGAGGASEPIAAGPFACPPQQWTCASRKCDYSTLGLRLPETCRCDITRPLSAADCQLGQVFVCQDITAATDGRPFTEPVALSCSCVPKGDDVCENQCFAAYDIDGDVRCRRSEDELGTLCGCAIPYLK